MWCIHICTHCWMNHTNWDTYNFCGGQGGLFDKDPHFLILLRFQHLKFLGRGEHIYNNLQNLLKFSTNISILWWLEIKPSSLIRSQSGKIFHVPNTFQLLELMIIVLELEDGEAISQELDMQTIQINYRWWRHTKQQVVRKKNSILGFRYFNSKMMGKQAHFTDDKIIHYSYFHNDNCIANFSGSFESSHKKNHCRSTTEFWSNFTSEISPPHFSLGKPETEENLVQAFSGTQNREHQGEEDWRRSSPRAVCPLHVTCYLQPVAPGWRFGWWGGGAPARALRVAYKHGWRSGVGQECGEGLWGPEGLHFLNFLAEVTPLRAPRPGSAAGGPGWAPWTAVLQKENMIVNTLSFQDTENELLYWAGKTEGTHYTHS
jgi:hypothetical protein